MKCPQPSRPGGIAGLALLASLVAAASPARGDVQLISNGGFETGLSGWSRSDQLGSEGSFFLQSGSASPVTLLPVPPPPGGTFAAMTDAEGGGSHVLYQDFLVPTTAVGGVLRFSLYVGNQANAFFTPGTLDWATPTLNQQARVDILAAGTDPFSVATPGVLLNVFQTRVGDPLVSGYTNYTVDVSALLAAQAGRTLRLRFAEVDNVSLFQFGVDNVSLIAAVPEPSSIVLAGLGLAGVAAVACRRKAVLGGSKARH
ncbi:MAG: PEP-CTERM sorting domain-containing protein [Isosphaeraceae bacterium]